MIGALVVLSATLIITFYLAPSLRTAYFIAKSLAYAAVSPLKSIMSAFMSSFSPLGMFTEFVVISAYFSRYSMS
jgi:hypothetical protein